MVENITDFFTAPDGWWQTNVWNPESPTSLAFKLNEIWQEDVVKPITDTVKGWFGLDEGEKLNLTTVMEKIGASKWTELPTYFKNISEQATKIGAAAEEWGKVAGFAAALFNKLEVYADKKWVTDVLKDTFFPGGDDTPRELTINLDADVGVGKQAAGIVSLDEAQFKPIETLLTEIKECICENGVSSINTTIAPTYNGNGAGRFNQQAEFGMPGTDTAFG